jgi:hypothetical protein
VRDWRPGLGVPLSGGRAGRACAKVAEHREHPPVADVAGVQP